ncbi:MAG: hypothetical protein ABI639_06605 [Thermoanaerobaculia bacterium]
MFCERSRRNLEPGTKRNAIGGLDRLENPARRSDLDGRLQNGEARIENICALARGGGNEPEYGRVSFSSETNQMRSRNRNQRERAVECRRDIRRWTLRWRAVGSQPTDARARKRPPSAIVKDGTDQKALGAVVTAKNSEPRIGQQIPGQVAQLASHFDLNRTGRKRAIRDKSHDAAAETQQARNRSAGKRSSYGLPE